MVRINKICVFVLAISLFSVALYGQRTLGLTVISAYGHEASSASYITVHTVGELMTETFTGTSGNFYLTQGFHQNDGIQTELAVKNTSISKIYPNPSKGLVYIKLNDGEGGIVRLDLFDITGKQILNTVIDTKFENKVDISKFNNGIYFLKVSSASGSLIFTHKLEKID